MKWIKKNESYNIIMIPSKSWWSPGMSIMSPSSKSPFFLFIICGPGILGLISIVSPSFFSFFIFFFSFCGLVVGGLVIDFVFLEEEEREGRDEEWRGRYASCSNNFAISLMLSFPILCFSFSFLFFFLCYFESPFTRWSKEQKEEEEKKRHAEPLWCVSKQWR